MKSNYTRCQIELINRSYGDWLVVGANIITNTRCQIELINRFYGDWLVVGANIITNEPALSFPILGRR